MRVHEIDFKIHTFDIVSCDANFSIFLADRKNLTFDRIVAERSLDKFYSLYHKYLRDVEDAAEIGQSYEDYVIVRDRFSLNLYDEYGLENTYIGSFYESKIAGCIKLSITNVDALIDEVTHYELEQTKTAAVMSLYDDKLFEYYPAMDTIKLYYMDNLESEYMNVNATTVENYMVKNWPDRAQDIHEFFDGIKAGIFKQMLYMQCNVDDPTAEGVTTTIESTAVTSDDQLVASVGYIHINHHNKKLGYSSTKVDPATGLLERSVIIEKAKLYIDLKKRYQTTIGLLTITNFDELKANFDDSKIKSLYQSISRVFQKNLHAIGMAGSLNENTFMLIYSNIVSPDYMRGYLDSLTRDLQLINTDNSDNPQLQCKIAMCHYPTDAKCFQEMCGILRYTLDEAKKSDSPYKIYSADTDIDYSKISELVDCSEFCD